MRYSTRRLTAAALACAAVAVLGAAGPSPAGATVRSAAAPWTPRVLSKNATVRQLVPCGHMMYAVGRFHLIGQHGHHYPRRNAFSFDARTGIVSAWNPGPHGLVNSIALGPHCGIAYLGGKFTQVGSTRVHNLVAVSTRTGAIVPGFRHSAGGKIDTLAMIRQGRQLLVGGAFTSINGRERALFASLDPQTGVVTPYLRPRVTGRLANSTGVSQVYNQQVSRDGRKLLIEGDFTHVGGRLRQQVAQIDLGPRHARVDPWHSYQLNHGTCADDFVFYVRAAAFSPDTRTVYLAATGFDGSSPFCDAVSAVTNTAPARIKWVNKTGGDSLYAVAATRAHVYIAGHERWADNPDGSNSCGPGCVRRPGVGVVSAATGQAMPWNPTRDRGHGADDLLITRAGVWVASDTFYNSVRCAHRFHPGICFFPGRA